MTKDNDEWGNIELPGFSDEELFDPNINFRLAAKSRWNDPKSRQQYLNAFRERFSNLTNEQRKAISIKNKLAYANMSEQQKDLLKQKKIELWQDKEYRNRMMEYYNTPEYKNYITQKNRNLALDPDWKEKVSENNKAKRQNTKHVELHAKSVKDRSNNNEKWIRKNCRPVSTPYGVFQKAKDAAVEYQKEHGGVLTSISIKLRQWYKKDSKPEWKYITWEEYDNWKLENN